MGAVYRVEDTKVDEEVALKLINPLVASDKKTIERFRNELKFARKVRHKHVCQMFDLGESDDTHFITMEYVPGEDLKSLLRRTGKLTIETGVRIAKQLAEGLTEAHRLGIVHRDLKPGNIMIDKQGQARIMDFGIARSKEAKGITGVGLVIGTPEYMSPEQAEGKEADSRSDIYSLGVILFEILTGQRPFEGDSALGIAMKHKGEEPQEPLTLNPNIPKSVNDLVLKCLKKNPADRYQNTEEIIAELGSLDLKPSDIKTKGKQKSGLISKEITVSFSLRKFLVPTVILVILIAVGLFFWRPWGQKAIKVVSSDKPTLAIVHFKNITGDREIDWFKRAFPEYLMVDLGLSKYINVVDMSRILGILQDLDLSDSEDYTDEDLRKICEQSQASHILKGLFLKSEAGHTVNVSLQKAGTLEILGTEQVEGNLLENHTDPVDQLTRKIKNLFGISETQIANDIDKNISEMRPDSKEAYELFHQGYYAHFVDRNYIKAIDLYKKTLEIEPEFGYAYSLLAQCYFNIGMPLESKKFGEEAVKRKGTMSMREWNYAVAYLNINSEKTIDAAFAAFQEILKDYPDEYDANIDSGSFHLYLEDYEVAVDFYENIYGSSFANPYIHLSQAYCAQGFYDMAEESLRYYIENYGEDERLRSQLALVFLCQGNNEKALLEIEKSPKTDLNLPHLYALGQILFCMEDFKGAEDKFEELKKSQWSWYQYVAYKNYHNTLVAQGRFKEARAHLDRGMDFFKKEGINDFGAEFCVELMYNFIKAGQAEDAINLFDDSWEVAQSAGFGTEAYCRRLTYLKGMAALVGEELDEAQTIITSLKELINSGKNKKAIRMFYHLSGLVEERNGNLEKALEFYSDALELAPYDHDCEFYLRLDRAPYLESMGDVYFRMGELDKAIDQFDKIQSLTLGRLDYGDIYAKSYYNLGKIFEQKGWEGKAMEQFEKFLELWKDADPGLPEVADARERVAVLRQQ